MANHYVLSNGNLLVNYNRHANITDLYFPFIGHKNHVGGHLCGLALLTPRGTHWIGNDWISRGSYFNGSLLAKIRFELPGAGLALNLTQAVHQSEDTLLVSLELENLSHPDSEFSVAFYNNFRINENEVGDTAAYLPDPSGLLHYKEDVFLLMGARDGHGRPFQRWEIVRRDGSARASWEAISTGHFACQPIRQGNVDSAIAIDLHCPAGNTADADAWIVAARSLDEIRHRGRLIQNANIPLLLEQTHLFWCEWSGSCRPVDNGLETAFRESLLLVRSQCDNRGGIVAANDTAVLRFNGDHYSYVWPRDAALVARILLHLGIPDVARRFLGFCGRIVDEEGVILHKFRANGTLGSSWHGWLHNNEPSLPIQEDEIALPLLLLADYFQRARDVEFARNCYIDWGRKCLGFLMDYVDPKTGLPKPSHDLWEERLGVHAFTVAAVWSALRQSGRMAQRLGFIDDADRAFGISDRMREAFCESFWDPGEGIFARSLLEDGSRDLTPDSSTYAIWYFNLIAPADPRLKMSMAKTWDILQIRAGTGGIARYHNDYYHRITDKLEEVPGNPWIISTLWAAQWFALTGDTERASQLTGICLARRNGMGLLPEQWNPYTGAPLSVMPLTWSHAVMAETLGCPKESISSGDF